MYICVKQRRHTDKRKRKSKGAYLTKGPQVFYRSINSLLFFYSPKTLKHLRYSLILKCSFGLLFSDWFSVA